MGKEKLIGLSYGGCISHIAHEVPVRDIGIITPEQVIALFANTHISQKKLSDPQWIKSHYPGKSTSFLRVATSLNEDGRILQPRLALTEIETKIRGGEMTELQRKIDRLVSDNSYGRPYGRETNLVDWFSDTPDVVKEEYLTLTGEFKTHRVALEEADEYAMPNVTSSQKVWWKIEQLLGLEEESPELYSIWQKTVALQATGKTREILAPYFGLPTEEHK